MSTEGTTIAAIATPAGAGGIGIVRLSGGQAKSILKERFRAHNEAFQDFRPWMLHKGEFLAGDGAVLDVVLVVYMPGPRTFTGEDVAEIHCHGGHVLVQAVLQSLLDAGAHVAERGEFSRRAFMNGRMDLSQAEAVADMIAATSTEAVRLSAQRLDGALGRRVTELREQLEHLRRSLCLAVDFPEEEVECLSREEFGSVVRTVCTSVEGLIAAYERCRPVQDGATVVLAGAVNAGKSSLLNALLGHNRALVTDIPGTTRDFLEEHINLNGLSVRLVDTAGFRDSDDTVECLGMQRSSERMAQADAIVLVLDGTLGEVATMVLEVALEKQYAHHTNPLSLAAQENTLMVWNKCDLAPEVSLGEKWKKFSKKCFPISAKDGTGLDALEVALKSCIISENTLESAAGDVVPNMRQAHILSQAAHELRFLDADIQSNLPYDVCAVPLDAAVSLLGQITGLDSTDQMLNAIFNSFCIGK